MAFKEHYIDTHNEKCDSDWCNHNAERFLFYLKGKFILVTYHHCLSQYEDKYDFKLKIINTIIKNNKVFPSYEVNKSVDVEKDLKDFRIRNKQLRNTIKEVNYLYYSNNRKEYAITTTIKYIDSICLQEDIDESYNEAKKYLTDQQYNWLLDSLENLYYSNKVYNVNNVEIHNTIDHLIKTINQITK